MSQKVPYDYFESRYEGKIICRKCKFYIKKKLRCSENNLSELDLETNTCKSFKLKGEGK